MLITIALLALALVAGCKSLTPVHIEGQPDECNDWYTVMEYDVLSGGNGAIVGVVYPDCQAARKDKRRIARESHCKKMVFGADNLNKSDYKRYNEYLECLK
jgi:hypothetical protein